MKKILLVLLTLLVAAAFVMTGCPPGDNGDKCPDCGEEPCVCEPAPTTQEEIAIDQTGIKEDEKASGKGYITGDNFNKVKDAPEGSYLLITLSGTANLNWGSIGCVGIDDMEGPEDNRVDFAPKAGGTYEVEIMIADIFKLKGGDEAEKIYVNVWGEHTITKVELVKDEDYTPPPPVDEKTYEKGVLSLGDFTAENNDSQKGWEASKGGLKWEHIADAKYFVLETEGEGDNANGFGGIQVVLQGNGSLDGEDKPIWNESTIVDGWVSISRSTGKTYLIIELSKLKNYDDFIKGTAGKILVCYYGSQNIPGLALKEAYFTTLDLPRPAAAVNIAIAGGWAAKEITWEGASVDDDLLIFDGKAALEIAGTVTQGTLGSNVITVNKNADKTVPEYTLRIKFNGPQDLSDLTYLNFDFGGASPNFKQANSNIKFFFGAGENPALMAQQRVQGRNGKYELGEGSRNWSGSEDWDKLAECTGFEIFMDAIDVDDGAGGTWFKLGFADAQALTFSKIWFD